MAHTQGSLKIHAFQIALSSSRFYTIIYKLLQSLELGPIGDSPIDTIVSRSYMKREAFRSTSLPSVVYDVWHVDTSWPSCACRNSHVILEEELCAHIVTLTPAGIASSPVTLPTPSLLSTLPSPMNSRELAILRWKTGVGQAGSGRRSDKFCLPPKHSERNLTTITNYGRNVSKNALTKIRLRLQPSNVGYRLR